MQIHWLHNWAKKLHAMELRDCYFQFKEILQDSKTEQAQAQAQAVIFVIFLFNYCLKFQENGKKMSTNQQK